MPTPSITLTATVQDLFGMAVGSAANPSKMAIALCGFGPQFPIIAGTSVLGKVGPIFLESANGSFSTQLWGNDVISPTGTYYTVAILDGQGNVLQTAAYQFTGSGTIDLSNAVPIIPPYGAPATAINSKLCSGAMPGSVFAAPGPIIMLYVNGIMQRPGIDYNLSGAQTIATLTYTVEATDNVYALCISY